MSERERKIEAIAKAARPSRPRYSRTFWIAVAASVACIAAFVAILSIESGPASKLPAVSDSGRGFGTGIVIGVGVGIAIGYAIARKKS